MINQARESERQKESEREKVREGERGGVKKTETKIERDDDQVERESFILANLASNLSCLTELASKFGRAVCRDESLQKLLSQRAKALLRNR